MRVLDLFCGAGGASKGYADIGFEVIGVDIEPQPHYPYEFICADATTFDVEVGGFDLIHASPPCQKYSKTAVLHDKNYPDLIEITRNRLKGHNYVIENVAPAPLINATILCGSMFGLRLYRHRHFETSFPVEQPACYHTQPQTLIGRRWKEGEIMTVCGHFSSIEIARSAMQIDWMTRDEMAQAIPPAFTRYIALNFLKSEGLLWS